MAADAQNDTPMSKPEERTPLAQRLLDIQEGQKSSHWLERANEERKSNPLVSQVLDSIDRFLESTLPEDLESVYKGIPLAETYIYKKKGCAAVHLNNCTRHGFPASFSYAIEHLAYGNYVNIKTTSISRAITKLLKGSDIDKMAWEYFWSALCNFATKNGFSDLRLEFGHDGVGLESWPMFELRF